MASNEQIIWKFLKKQGLTDAGAAGLMGNLYAESALTPTNLQNSYNKKLNLTDNEYTAAVDSGKYKNFVRDSAGYGLAQWTYWSRKENLLKYANSKGKSIGDINMQLEFLMQELNAGYKNLLNTLKTTNSVKEASNGVLLQFERPADQGVAVQNKRAEYGQTYYNKYANSISKDVGNMKYSVSNPPLICMQTNSTCYKGTRPMNVLGVLWHSTGANNTTLKRYVQPSESDANYNQLIAVIGKNPYGNDWNHIERQAGLNAWIGKLANGEVAAVQTMPWNYRPWGCGSGRNGSCNDGWIQFEICEDNLTDVNYFNAVYKEACELTAYLCKMHNLDPRGYVIHKGVQVPVILCHADSYKLGLGGNHGDVLHWFSKYGKTMNDVRNDVAKLMEENIIVPPPAAPVVPIVPPKKEEEEEVTQEKFNEMMNNWIAEQAKKDASSWSAEARDWAEKAGLISGDTDGKKMYKKFLTREELAAVLYRALHRHII